VYDGPAASFFFIGAKVRALEEFCFCDDCMVGMILHLADHAEYGSLDEKIFRE
jgi:hypothetical protein